MGQTYTIDAKGGEELRLEVWVENLPAGEKLKEWNVVMPCSAPGGVAGSIVALVMTLVAALRRSRTSWTLSASLKSMVWMTWVPSPRSMIRAG